MRWHKKNLEEFLLTLNEPEREGNYRIIRYLDGAIEKVNLGHDYKHFIKQLNLEDYVKRSSRYN
jgi:hypothetical protein